MADDEDNGAFRRYINFQPVISLGNLLIVLTMLGSIGGTLLVIGREVQSVADSVLQLQRDLMHETEMRIASEKSQTEARVQSEKGIVAQIGDMTNQESRDVQSIKETLQNMRDDYRELLRVSGPTRGRQ